MSKKVRKVVFPVAGLGTRFLPATKSVPKEMLPVVDRPLIQYAVDEAKEAGIEHFIFVTGRGKTAIADYFDHAYELEQTLSSKGKTQALNMLTEMRPRAGAASFLRQQEPAGLGHAVWCARDLVGDEPFAVILADELLKSSPGCLAQMVEAYERTQGNVVGLVDVPKEHTDRYGVIKPGARDGKLVEVSGMIEKPKPDAAPSTLALVGRYILQPSVFDHLARQDRGAGGEIQLTDAMARLIGNEPFHGLEFDGTRFDCGNKVGFMAANVAYALEREDMADELRAYLRSVI
ncbi:UTP--glucose-1-phosphate uridylyltransferase GalU [Pyruvatibacter mobilis]|jgi:UTP--glucose-1-phosphate uridylyltransferase|uniref:UTP--glucose-1-phosphate uridylyltransferase n=1 Tax=Pyruvatibacter mobilis TaxID=1712261 RepID=A0A845Q8E8_9HYPH|nr:UTP--glucose-1-phosphate uridylyltransferase GalU [Pyruvatibacter mobilis]NBG94659.1 UTP--glucose-1-phosphate uridylyltransferase GalU [Pyruvatibacter mobilis]QJD74167.1 UTP--glucose-1-phosphate uridylyltransferase GalU [Pyruvatibacter mobilis]GGD04708.1 UTP--glucose-1-phosphate uridylyltransferase [Pyruvatibacter mobilis]